MESEKKIAVEKKVLDDVKINKRTEGEITSYTSYSKSITSYPMKELTKSRLIRKEIYERVEFYLREVMPNISEKQLKFSLDIASLVFGIGTKSKPIIACGSCGFGKTMTFKAIIKTAIWDYYYKKRKPSRFGFILVSERIQDLAKLADDITKEHNYYKKISIGTDGVKEDVLIPWVYVMKSWSTDTECEMNLKSFDESIDTCPKCHFRRKCSHYNQLKEQSRSSIVAISTERFYRYADKNELKLLKKWGLRGTENEPNKRTTLLVDEKPRLLKINNVHDTLFDSLRNTVDNYNDMGNLDLRQTKKNLKTEIERVREVVNENLKKHEKFENALVYLEGSSFHKNFLTEWKSMFATKHKDDLKAIKDLFHSGGLFCRTTTFSMFKTIEKSNFYVQDFRTIIADATADVCLEYEQEDFLFLDVDKYRTYGNLTFHFVKGNYSKTKLLRNQSLVDPVCLWMNKNLNSKTYLVSYKQISPYLYNKMRENPHIVKVVGRNSEEMIAYFGNTKGKNEFRDCRTMIQIGFNRLDTDNYLANAIASRKQIKLNLLKLLDADYEKNKEMFQFFKGKFKNDYFEWYRNLHLFNELEQEVFRTKARMFTSDDDVDIYLFGGTEIMKELIRQRFTECKIKEEEWVEMIETKARMRKGSENNKCLKFLDWIRIWDGSPIKVSRIKEKFDLNDNYWKEAIKHPLIKNEREMKNISSDFIFDGYYWSYTKN